MPVTDHEIALRALEELRTRYEDLVRAAADWLWETDKDLRLTVVSDGMRRFNGDTDPAGYIGKALTDLVAVDRIDQAVLQDHRDDLENRRPFRNFRYAHIDQHGGLHNWSISGTPAFDADGNFVGYRGLGRDITERARMESRLQELNAELEAEIRERRLAQEELTKARDELDKRVTERTAELHGANETLRQEIAERRRVERALEESRDQLRLVTDNLPVWIAYVDADRRFRFANKTVGMWLARPIRDILGTSVADLFKTPQEYEKIRPWMERALAGEQVSFNATVDHFDGVSRTIQVTYVPHVGVDRRVEGCFALIEDISELRRTEAALRQAQKMEAVGQLTGGVAHDFNNLLAVIAGNAELLEDEVGDLAMVDSIKRAARRGAELTQRLLSFSRRQSLLPQPIDLGELLSSLESLLKRTLGAQISVVVDIPDATWRVLADAGQLENAILNLSINARDAMPDGGSLEIACANIALQDGNSRVGDEVVGGDYVCITVKDSGIGMAPEVLEHAFEPFYTTKDVGEGSGLGLSMVYGFARQSGGDAVITSRSGEGAEVNLYLPRAAAQSAEEVTADAVELTYGRGEKILVLEDDPDVRQFAVNVLELLEYEVREAADADAAMLVLRNGDDRIDLLLSDIVLPGGVNGPDFAVKAKTLAPELKVVFMTGYAADATSAADLSEIGEALLNKPFRRADLAKAIADALSR